MDTKKKRKEGKAETKLTQFLFLPYVSVAGKHMRSIRAADAATHGS